MISKVRPPAKRVRPMRSVSWMTGSVARRACGMEFTAMMGMRQRETQTAWPKKATRNLGGDFLISSKRESWPSAMTRWKRYVPTVCLLVKGSYGL